MDVASSQDTPFSTSPHPPLSGAASAAPRSSAARHPADAPADQEIELTPPEIARQALDRRIADIELLADASALLNASLDVNATLANLAAFVVPRLASGCAIDLVDFAGRVERVALSDEDAHRAHMLRELRVRVPLDAVPDHPIHAVLRTGEPFLVTEVDEAYLRRVMGAGGDIALARKVVWRSLVILPLSARGRTFGTLMLGADSPRPKFDTHSVRVGRALAERAALAVDNARLFAEAERARWEAEAANRAKSEFLATMSHELRTPLTAIRGFTELLLDEIVGPLNDTQRDELQRVDAAGQHLLLIVDDVLRYSKLAAGGEEMHFGVLKVGDVCEGALDLVRPLAEQKRLEFVSNVDQPAATLLSDAGKLHQVLVNLLANAVKFTTDGSVELRTRVLEALVEFHVLDTGPGIPEAFHDVIFEPFTQVDQSFTRRAGGTGLGLSIARKLARLLGGDVTVVSEGPRGSRFTLRLPRQL